MFSNIGGVRMKVKKIVEIEVKKLAPFETIKIKVYEISMRSL